MNLESHLKELPAADAAAFRRVVARLRACPEKNPSAGFAARVLAALETGRASNNGGHFAFRLGLALAACLVICLGLVCFTAWRAGTVPNADLAWLADHQNADGSWSPELNGGSAAYRPALTALAVLALGRDPSRYADRIRSGCDALVALQQPDSTFGGRGQSLYYNQAIATYTLAAFLKTRPGLRPSVERSVAFIRSHQSPSGGWDYTPGFEGNSAITAWFVQGLSRAEACGIRPASEPLRKGLRWLRRSTRDNGQVAYHPDSTGPSTDSLNALIAYTLMTAGQLFDGLPNIGRRIAGSLSDAPANGGDCYRDFNKVCALETAGATSRAALVRGQLAANRRQNVPDAWQSIGGRIYSAALAALANAR